MARAFVTVDDQSNLPDPVRTKLKGELDTRYAPKVETAVLTRDSSGRITSAVENGITVTYTRDSAGRIQSETKSGKTTTYTRDSSGRVASWETVNA
ncbi:hypothetical protein [Rhodococcoides fascians]|uniref:hypothetical protein n=1 Tax=Rhodococcoides fascians TaxID=1828 RepID=UPI00050C49D1|nr:hypothetical protein [Rhodococcus fascians]